MLQTCPSCHAETMGPDTRELSRKVGGITFRAEVRVECCATCGEWYLGYDDGQRFEVAVALSVVDHGIDAPDAFKFMRKAAGLRAVDLAALLGVTPETVSRWETGKVAVERRALALLQALVSEHAEGVTTTRDRLRALAGDKKRRPRSIRVAL